MSGKTADFSCARLHPTDDHALKFCAQRRGGARVIRRSRVAQLPPLPLAQEQRSKNGQGVGRAPQTSPASPALALRNLILSRLPEQLAGDAHAYEDGNRDDSRKMHTPSSQIYLSHSQLGL